MFEWISFHVADVVVVRGRYHKEILSKIIKKVEWIPDGVDIDIFKFRDAGKLKKEMGLEGSFVVGTVGSINYTKKLNWCYGMEIVEAIRLLKNYPVKGVIVGNGNGLPLLKELCKKYGIEDRVVFVGRIEKSRLPDYINLMDVCVSTQTNDIAGWVRATGKLPLYLACERYVLCSDVGEAHYILPEEMRIPMVSKLDIDYPSKLAERLRKIIENNKSLRWSEGRKIAEEVFGYDRISSSACFIIEKLIRNFLKF